MKDLKIKYIGSKRAWGFCPILECLSKRKNKNKPNLEITLEGPYTGYYYCWSGCGYSGKLQPKELKEIMKNKKKSIKRLPTTIDWHKLTMDYVNEFNKKNIIKPFDVHKFVLTYLRCGWDGKAWTFPVKNECSEIIGIQRRFDDNSKYMVEGSKLGLFIPIMRFNLSDTLYICEGVSDLAILLDCDFQGIARPSCNTCENMIEDFLYLNSFEVVTVVADNDTAGIKGAMNISSILANDGYLCSVLIPKPFSDLRELYANIGREETIKFLRS